MSLPDAQTARHRQLVEKWIYEDLSDAELAELPEELRERTRGYCQGLVDEALESVTAGRVVDGPRALARIRQDLRARFG